MRIQLLFGFLVLALVACGPGVRNDGDDVPPGDDASVSEDAGGGGDAIGPDLGDPCTTTADCPGGYCVDGPSGDVCSYACDQLCPLNWQCRVASVDGALVSVCLPVIVEVCSACTADDQCTGGACIELNDGNYCLAACFEGSCPTGYTCGPDPSGEHAGPFCIPDTTGCTCTNGNDGAIRTCMRTNGVGTCSGFETCDPPNGWVGCSAADAMPEMCDGIDNDCDFLIDDGVSGTMCMVDVPGVGSCPGMAVCTGAGGVVCQGPTPMTETCNYTNDDCDANTDEGFAGLGDTCMAGVGACQRFGVNRCTANQMGVECSAVAGTGSMELCNAVDDDCDTRTDEAFTDLGMACSAGNGICLRQGSRVCAANGMSTTCSAVAGTPGMEACNTLDDDCDTRVDEDFRNPVTGAYDRDTACGSCGVDCTELYDLPGASGTCNTSGSPTCQMVCDPNAFNLDGQASNGCELVLDPGAIYVSIADGAAADDGTCGLGPVGTGAGNHPCRTITFGISRAQATSRARVLVANGNYAESVNVQNGISLLGGYQPDTWARDVAGTGTLITGVSSSGNHDHTVVANGITLATVVEGFVIYGSTNTKIRGNSYAIYVNGSSGNLAIRDNVIFAGRGGPGTAGMAGSSGTNGADGVGRPSNPNGYDAFITSGAGSCDPSNNRTYTNGAAGSCGGDDVSGGNGGGNVCPPSQTLTEMSGRDGTGGQAGNNGGTAGGAGDAGDDMRLEMAGSLCYVPAAPDYGYDGTDGANATNGAMAAGCSATTGSVSGGHWLGTTAPNGAAGGNGGGGGGGGAGGGSYCLSCPGNQDRLGGHGGGGGAGGCGGTGGDGATAGGGVFGIFVVGGTAPVITGNDIFRGLGGTGGNGGAGGTGGTGGIGAAGGTSTVFCTGRAGRGGNGGNGGHGSGGGGGCGGSSYGIYTSGVGTPTYCQAAANNGMFGGNGGNGGAGGYSIINQGGTGAMGATGSCSFN